MTLININLKRQPKISNRRYLLFAINPNLSFTFTVLRDYMNITFQNGFILDGFDERAFPPEHPQTSTLGWGGKFSEMPPVLIARMRLR